jgi:hypothetical protein
VKSVFSNNNKNVKGVKEVLHQLLIGKTNKQNEESITSKSSKGGPLSDIKEAFKRL